jgi:hypothetical protein
VSFGTSHTQASLTATMLWTFSDTDTAGVETIVRTFPGSPTTPAPDYCSAGSDAPVPSSVLQFNEVLPRDSFVNYEIIITAGEEKLSATTGGAVTTSGPEPTGPQTSNQGPAASETGNGASAPMRTMVPALAGLGAAAAVFL